MKIEIITTKKKLTKSILSQMKTADLFELKNGTVLGYVLNSIKNKYKAILIECNDNYYTISASYKKCEISVYRMVGKWSHTRKFTSTESCNEFWKYYQEVLNKAKEQIYI